MRTYRQTHPWIQFRLDSSTVSPGLWLALGEAKSKCEHIAGVPLKAATAKQMMNIYLAKGTAATTAIEGNTLTEAQVLQRLQGQLQLPLSKEYLGIEVDNVLAACNALAKRLERPQGLGPLSKGEILEINGRLLQGLELPKGVVAGQVRTLVVGVANYLGAPHEDCEYLLDRLCQWLEAPDFAGGLDLHPIVLGILKAIMAHLYIAWIHPFGDGNGRTARMLELRLLLGAGVPTPAAHLLSNYYNQTRNEYYRRLEQASVSGGDVIPFLAYSTQGFVDGLAEQLEFIKEQQWAVTWADYVEGVLIQQPGNLTVLRQRRLMRELNRQKEPLTPAYLSVLNPELADDYRRKSEKTLRRDIQTLVKIGLVIEEGKKIRPAKEKILAFLPPRAREASPGDADVR